MALHSFHVSWILTLLLMGRFSSTTFGASLHKPSSTYDSVTRSTSQPPSKVTIIQGTAVQTNFSAITTQNDQAKEEGKKNGIPPFEMIRQCTCAESDVCISKAWSKISTCQAQCKDKLEFFGDNTDALLGCFDNDPNGGTLINNCFKTISGYCSYTSQSAPKYIQKPTYEPKLDTSLKFKEHEIIEAFKAFHICAGGCMKEIIIECFEEKECGVSLGDTQDIGKIGEFCHSLKGSIYATSTKALPCLMPGLKPRERKI
jgi:hypothetical protein